VLGWPFNATCLATAATILSSGKRCAIEIPTTSWHGICSICSVSHTRRAHDQPASASIEQSPKPRKYIHYQSNYFAAEYCVPLWVVLPLPRQVGREATEWNRTHRVWTIRPNPLHWLPLPSHTAPPSPAIRRTVGRLFAIFRPNHIFLFTRTSSVTWRLAWNPVGQYGPQTKCLQWMNSRNLTALVLPRSDLVSVVFSTVSAVTLAKWRCSTSLYTRGITLTTNPTNPLCIWRHPVCVTRHRRLFSEQDWRWSPGFRFRQSGYIEFTAYANERIGLTCAISCSMIFWRNQ